MLRSAAYMYLNPDMYIRDPKKPKGMKRSHKAALNICAEKQN